jgi:CRP-like cAMP-binding protein
MRVLGFGLKSFTRFSTTQKVFYHLTPKMQFCKVMTFKSFPKGRLLVHEGDASTCFCFLLSGQCEVFKIKDGFKHILCMINAGDCFGERSMLHLNDKRVDMI